MPVGNNTDTALRARAPRRPLGGRAPESHGWRPDETSGKPYGVPTGSTPGSTDGGMALESGIVWCGPEADCWGRSLDPGYAALSKEEVAGAMPVVEIHTGTKRQGSAYRNSDGPERTAVIVEVEEEAVAGPAGTVEDEPFVASRRGDEVGAAGADPRGHFVHFRDGGLDAPRGSEHALCDPAPGVGDECVERAQNGARSCGRGSHAAQTCSRNGSVSPRPSFPASGWQ